MKKYRDPLSYTSLWSVRWLTGVLLLAQLICGVLGMMLLSYPRSAQNFGMGGAFATLPAFVLGLVLQRRIAPGLLSEDKLTAWILGAISLAIFGFAVQMAMDGWHAR